MSGRDKPKLLGDLSLEPVGLGTFRCQCLIAFSHVGREERKGAGLVMCEHGVQADATVAQRCAEERSDAGTSRDVVEDLTSERRRGEQRDIGEEERLSGQEVVARSGCHHRPPRDRAAS